MATLIQYVLSTGVIRQIWETNDMTLLAAQIVTDDPVYGYLLADDLGATVLTTRWYVTAEALTAKAMLTITATPTPFAADGVEECLITVDPFVECLLLVNGEPMALTTGDTTLELTSDVPTVFHVDLAPLVTHWADPITVEAT